MTEQDSDISAVDDFKWLRENASLCTISVRGLSATRTAPGKRAEYDVAAKASFGRESDHIHVRIHFQVNITKPSSSLKNATAPKVGNGSDAESGQVELGELSTTIVASYVCAEDPSAIKSRGILKFAQEVAEMDIFPFARQTLSGLALQLGFDALPLVRSIGPYEQRQVV